VELLIENCAEVDAPSKPVRFSYNSNKHIDKSKYSNGSHSDGETALQWAAAAGHVSTVAALLGTPPGSCANPNCVPQVGGLSALHEAAGAGHTEVRKTVFTIKIIIVRLLPVNGLKECALCPFP